MVNIKKLINKGRWDLIEKNLDNVNLDSFIHLATMNNNKKIIDYALKNNLKVLLVPNEDGDTPIHLMARYGLSDLLKRVLEKKSEWINLQNSKFQTPLHILVKNGQVADVKWVIKNISEANYQLKDFKNRTVETVLINKSEKKDDQYYNILDSLLKKTKPSKEELGQRVIDATKISKDFLVRLYLEHGADPNVHDNDYMTPLQIAIFQGHEQIADLLQKYHADVNRTGPEGDQDPMMLAILRGDEDLVNSLFEKGYNPNQYNRYLETATHGVLSKTEFSPSTIAKFLYHGDLNFKNIDGITPLHLFLRNHDWRQYEEILKHKKLDIFAVDKEKKTPLDYLKPSQLSSFMDLIAEGYLGQMDQEKLLTPATNESKKSCRVGDLNYKRCLINVKEQIMRTQRSYPVQQDEIELDSKFRLIEEKFSQNGRFNADTLHNMIYTVEMLKRHQEVGIPYQYYFPDKAMTELNRQKLLDLHTEPEHHIVSNLVKIYHDYCYEISPYLIIWNSPTVNYIHPNLEFYLINAVRSPSIRFIFLKITLVASPQSTHANILIIDKKNRIVDRFEPYGTVPYLENEKLDDLLKKRLIPFLEHELHDKVEYLGPKESLGGRSFQVLSNDSSLKVKNLGDPNGYCLAWTYWYLEMRVANPDIHPKKLIKKAIKKIVESYDQTVQGEHRFIYFIRNYSQRLDRMKNGFLNSVGVPKQNIYNIVLPKEQQNKVVKGLTNQLEKAVFPRFESK